jgi:hypothetical protein
MAPPSIPRVFGDDLAEMLDRISNLTLFDGRGADLQRGPPGALRGVDKACQFRIDASSRNFQGLEAVGVKCDRAQNSLILQHVPAPAPEAARASLLER